MSRVGNNVVAVKSAKVVSVVLHPFVMPIYVLLFLFSGNSMFAVLPLATKLYCLLVTGFSLMLVPLSSLPLFKRFRLIKSYSLDENQERVYPILVTVVFAFVGFWLLRLAAYTHVVQQLYLVLVLLLSVFSVITLRWKISMHLTAIGGACGFLMVLGMKYPGDMRGAFVAMLLLAGLLATCRLYLEKHTPAQVYAGFLLGFLVVFGILI